MDFCLVQLTRLFRSVTAMFCLVVTLQADALDVSFSGNFIQGGMVIGQVEGVKNVSFQGKPIALSPKGDFVFGFGRDFPASAQLTFDLQDGSQVTKTLKVKRRTYNIQRVEGIDKKIMSKDKSESDWLRIKRDVQAVKQARAKHIESQAFKSRFMWPLVARISGVYGSQRFYNGEPGRPHYGVDIAAPQGTPVVAPADGQVTLAQDLYYSGGTIILDHGYGVSSSLLHLSEILVSDGEQVKQGQVVAKVGSTGRSTGPHLDWRMNWYKQRIDPQLLVEPMPE